MKSFVSATIVVAGFMLNACSPTATFDKPQPEDTKAMTEFPVRLQGRYLANDEASVLIINDKLVIRQFDFEYKEHRDSLGSSYKLTFDTLIDQENGSREKVMINGDTVIRHANWVDTLFNISTDNVLKKFKGYYFLNTSCGDSCWEVLKLSLSRGVLIIGSISGKEDIRKLKEIAETDADTTSTAFSLTRKQFKKFIRNGGFEKEETFKRMKGKSR